MLFLSDLFLLRCLLFLIFDYFFFLILFCFSITVVNNKNFIRLPYCKMVGFVLYGKHYFSDVIFIETKILTTIWATISTKIQKKEYFFFSFDPSFYEIWLSSLCFFVPLKSSLFKLIKFILKIQIRAILDVPWTALFRTNHLSTNLSEVFSNGCCRFFDPLLFFSNLIFLSRYTLESFFAHLM